MLRRMSAPRPDEAERRALELLGLALRAGRVVIGTRAVREAGAAGRLRSVLLAEDAGAGARGRLGAALGARGVTALRVSSRKKLAAALGREDLVTAGVTDEAFARRLAELLERDPGAEAAGPGEAGPEGRGRED